MPDRSSVPATHPAQRLRVVVTGSIAQYPLGGMTWHHAQYPLALAQQGHDVYYLEDTGAAPYDPGSRSLVSDCRANVSYLADVMARFGLADRWAYRDLDGTWMGLSERTRATVLRSADLLLNVSGMLDRPEEYRAVSRLAYIDTDPVFNQLKLANGDARFRARVSAHDVHFSFGERLASANPVNGYRWQPTRQPIVLSQWRSATPPRDVFSTIMTWRARRRSPTHRGQTYGEKDVELLRFIDLPSLVSPAVIELAMNPGKDAQAPLRRLVAHGWQVVDPQTACRGLDGYRAYIESSLAEWSVAKSGYVRGRPGWFSERSACYLAAGRPVVVEDTGFSSTLPTGEGIVAFRTLEEAVAGVDAVRGAYPRHAEAARAIAAEYFDSEKVLGRLVEQAMA
jgi:hypothetical protein